MTQPPSEKTSRVYNHSSQRLLVGVGGHPRVYFRLLPECASPHKQQPVFVMALNGDLIDGEGMWSVDPAFDVHVTERHSDHDDSTLHISGLGIKPFTEEAPSEKDIKSAGVWAYRTEDNWVTVLGAGITGLTAAHELVVRGFSVQVIEKAHGSPVDDAPACAPVDRFKRGLRNPDVGGIARTQWTTQPLPRGDPPSPAKATLTAMRSVHGDCHWFGAAGVGPQSCDQYSAFGVPWSKRTGRNDDVAADLLRWLKNLSNVENRSVAAVQLVVIVYGDQHTQHVEDAYERLRTFLEYLDPPPGQAAASSKTAALREALARLEVFPTARLDVNEDPTTRWSIDPYVGLLVRVHEDLGLVAGEHGFRFFPGFYRHLRDTMRRTPIYDEQTRTFTARSAHDNLTEVAWQVFADPLRSYPTSLLRKPFTSIGGLVEQYRTMRRDLGYRPVDLLRFLLRLLRYMTSSTKRREAYYETMSWWDFLSLKQLDPRTSESQRFTFGMRFETILRHAPKALVAMASELADARTQGNIAVQLFMDQFNLHDQSDSTLSGPTSSAWFKHWRTYLERQGVRFFLGEVSEIGLQDGTANGAANAQRNQCRATVKIIFPQGKPPREYIDAEELLRNGRISAHYYLSAMDIVGLARTTRSLRTAHAHSDCGVITDLGRLIGNPGNERDLEDIRRIGHTDENVEVSLSALVDVQPGLGDRFQTLTGIQFYYRHHVSFESGHIYFADSPWGLSAVSQIQYWGPFGGGPRSRLAGNLSVDIGAWRGVRGDPSSDPNQLSPGEIAAEVQRQIMAGLSKRRVGLECLAANYHLDDYIGFTQQGNKALPTRNHAPFLINVVGDWNNRPRGEPWAPNDMNARDRVPGQGMINQHGIWCHRHDGYPVHFGNLVIAGTHMRTFTRMGTMEAANESARHAVNAILDHLTFQSLGGSNATSGVWLGHETERSRAASTRPGGAREVPHPPSLQPRKKTRKEPQHTTEVDRVTTPYGDYCDIWNPETHEFADLDFLRLVDSHLMEATEQRTDDAPAGSERQAPHLFDILRIDELPDCLDGDQQAIEAFELLGSVLSAFQESSCDALPSVFAVVEKVRKQLSALLQRKK